jgi:hypothetical protein
MHFRPLALIHMLVLVGDGVHGLGSGLCCVPLRR